MKEFSTTNQSVAFVIQQQENRRIKIPTPTEKLFFLNWLPRQPSAQYVVLVDGIIEADKVLMA